MGMNSFTMQRIWKSFLRNFIEMVVGIFGQIQSRHSNLKADNTWKAFREKNCVQKIFRGRRSTFWWKFYLKNKIKNKIRTSREFLLFELKQCASIVPVTAVDVAAMSSPGKSAVPRRQRTKKIFCFCEKSLCTPNHFGQRSQTCGSRGKVIKKSKRKRMLRVRL